MTFNIEARDLNGNLRTASTAEVFAVTVTGQPSATVVNPIPVSNSDGTYTVTQVLTQSETYSVDVKFGGTSLSGVPVTGIIV